ncbi:hypothetical protein [Streptomyces sp. WAC 01325]|uniref:hypothetical protein n=1 Tax=Streptomyces sp. WAC 01325 TaxID=2203202 RepID=UPI000F88576B|nr:hypothetical protein [Streptomyces sp. WAC 01325]
MSAAVGILAFILTRCEGQGPSFDDWKAQADAVCEKEGPNAGTHFQNASIAVDELNASDTWTEEQLNTTATELTDAGVAMRRIVGSWRALERPDGRGEDIDKLLQAGTAASGAYYDVADGVFAGAPTEEQGTKLIETAHNLAVQISDLGLKECQYWFGSPEDISSPVPPGS